MSWKAGLFSALRLSFLSGGLGGTRLSALIGLIWGCNAVSEWFASVYHVGAYEKCSDCPKNGGCFLCVCVRGCGRGCGGKDDLIA